MNKIINYINPPILKNPFIDKIESITALKKLTKNVLEEDFTNKSYSEIIEYLKSGIGFMPSLRFIMKPEQANSFLNLYRILTFDSFEKYKLDDENPDTFSYPQDDNLTTYGRANLPKCPVLYTASDAFTACKETSVVVGQKMYLSEWKISTNNDLRISTLLLDKVLQKNNLGFTLNVFDALNKMAPNWKNKEKNIRLVFNLINEIFTNDNKKYLLSSAIAHYNIYEIDHDILLYPSIASERTSFNAAFHPKLIKNNIVSLHNLKLVEVTKLDEGNKLEGKIIKFGLKKGSKIIWEAFETGKPLEDYHKKFRGSLN